MDLYIKNMISNERKLEVKEILSNLNLNPEFIELGRIRFHNTLHDNILASLQLEMKKKNFTLIEDPELGQVYQIKNCITEMILHCKQDMQNMALPGYLCTQITGKKYSYLNKLFLRIEGITIGKYVNLQKIERAKELIIADKLNISEIAVELGYHSTGYMSYQFKKITGIMPSRYRSLGLEQRKSMNDS